MLISDDIKLRAETLVSQWHADFRRFIGGNAGLDWQARRVLIEAVAAALAAERVDPVELREHEAAASQTRRRRNRGSDPQEAA